MSDKETLDVYAAQAETYAKKFAKPEPDRALAHFIAAVPAGGRVLDLGCGPGNSAAMMRDAGLVADASDASAEMVAMAHETYGVDAQLATFDDLDAVDIYDGIWANFSLLHAPVADMPANLTRIHSALKPGGILHLGLKTGEGEERDHLGRFYSYFQPDALNQMLINAGFTPASLHEGEEPGLAGIVSPFMIVTAIA